MTEEQIKKQQDTRQRNKAKRAEKERQEQHRITSMRKRLIRTIDSPTVTDSEALKAIQLLHDLDEEHRY